MQDQPEELSQLLDSIYRRESRYIFATLVRLLRDFDRAEDALQDAFRAALEKWPQNGIPENPRSWLISAGRFQAIDRLRRQAKFDPLQPGQAKRLLAATGDPSQQVDPEIEDDMLRLIFTCCHPQLSPEARAAMTLREVCGLRTEDVASAFLVPPATLAQRIVRAKARIRESGIPFEVPPEHELPARLHTVLQVIYLVFNEGYSASSGPSGTRTPLSDEAIRLGRLLYKILPQAEVAGLLALMLLQESRRTARHSETGDLILLQDQDRSLWNQTMIAEGLSLTKKAMTSHEAGPYALQAAIAALHAEAAHADLTDWAQICALYSRLLRMQPSPIVALNRAVAIAMHRGPEAGLQIVESIMSDGDLEAYHLAHATLADLYQRTGRSREALLAWERALRLARQDPERRFILKKIEQLKTQS